ncbi:hypothetical protein METESE_14110 [Mesoterricola sediminis]|uniref:histidine kinase n=1 Tax=Mesoterricola sediminis TaxID=2927980 RepID=A0AA48H5Q2_9BACT|nr:hypothetical protein METESE_14110 [Mesoterricola sediminis]
MEPVRIVKPRPRWLRPGSRPRAHRGPRAPFWFLGVAWAVLCAILAVIPHGYVRDARQASLNAWYTASHERATRLTQEWEHWTAPVPPFTRGDEPEVGAWLAREALLTALVDAETGTVWIREGDHLRKPRNAGERRVPADWAWRAMQVCPAWAVRGTPVAGPMAIRRDRGFDAGVGWLPGNQDPQFVERGSIVAYFGKWCLVKQWVPGSPEVERWLQGTLGSAATYRFGALNHRSAGGHPRPRPLAAYLGRPQPPDSGRVAFQNPDEAPFLVDRDLSTAFGGTWNVYLQMSPATFRAFRAEDLRRRGLAWTAYGLVVAGSGLALAAVLFTRKRERRIADRLASLTHSLKTPLAVLQLRCETALNPDLAQAEREARLLEIRNGADHMARTIEACLEEMRCPGGGRSQGLVGPDFFERLDEKASPAFEARDRVLEVYAAGEAFPCSPTALDSALSTLVENALMHGRGRVEVHAQRLADHMEIRVSDEGDGIPGPVLEHLAHRRGAPDRARREGGGLGLTVLADLAREEGWGLAFRAVPAGFEAVIDVPVG